MKNKDVTLFSGGARGAEAAFGRMAEKYGVSEVNFTFDGHHIERTVNTRFLTPEELAKSDMIMTEVSRRFSRDYSERPWIRNILQSICYQVNKGYQVFVVGHIEPDLSVKGGTGWSAELAKLFNRPLHAFDQEKNKWFTWRNGAWIEEEPFITHATFCGTGTRTLTPEGLKAIEDLFERSFGAK